MFDIISEYFQLFFSFKDQYVPDWLITFVFIIPVFYVSYRFFFKDDITLIENKLINNEKVIFSNYKIIAYGEEHKITNHQFLNYYCTLTDKAFYFLLHSKTEHRQNMGEQKNKAKIFKGEDWKRISYEELEIKFGKIFPNKFIELINRNSKFSIKISLHFFFNKNGKQIGSYIKENLMHLVKKS